MASTDSVSVPAQRHAQSDGSWRKRWWLPLLALIAVVFITLALPPYLTLDPTRSRIQPLPEFSAYYPLLVAHVIFASVAMITACFQIWTGLRRRNPKLHRLMGRLYVFGGVAPAGLAGLVIGSISPFGPILRASDVLLATLWLTCTAIGFWKARQHRFTEHRRWILRSFVLTFSIITNRIWAVIFTIVLSPQLATSFGGNPQLLVQTIAGLSGWLGWVIPLVIAEWWLIEPDRTAPAST